MTWGELPTPVFGLRVKSVTYKQYWESVHKTIVSPSCIHLNWMSKSFFCGWTNIPFSRWPQQSFEHRSEIIFQPQKREHLEIAANPFLLFGSHLGVPQSVQYIYIYRHMYMLNKSKSYTLWEAPRDRAVYTYIFCIKNTYQNIYKTRIKHCKTYAKHM